MSDVALRMEHVYKKFRKGEIYNTLRDLIPAMTGRIFREEELNDSDEREFWALQDVCFEVKHGESFGIIGNNGAGKSTMLKILSRIMDPTKGNKAVNGRLSALIEISAGFHPDLTGRENIFLNGTILGMSKREIKSRLDEIIAFSEIEEFIDTPVKRYSSGMFARLGFSVAAHVDPDILLVDEVLSVGDVAFQQKCMERMRAVASAGTTVVFISHNLQAVSEFCHRAMLLEHGKVAAIDSVSAVLERYLSGSQKPTTRESRKPVYISEIKVRDRAGRQSKFESGQTAWVEIEITARERVDNLTVGLYFLDETEYLLFSTSTERLGHWPFSLNAGDCHRCTFELTLNMANGKCRIDAAIHQNDGQKRYDQMKNGATIFVGSPQANVGGVNCFPKLVEAGTFDELPPCESGV